MREPDWPAACLGSVTNTPGAATSRSPAHGGPPFDATYQSLWPGLVRLGHLLTGSQALGEELAQEAFLGLLRAGDRVQEPGAYLRRSVVNLAMTSRRRAAFERTALSGRREEAAHLPEHDDLWPLLARLAPRQRCVLVLRYYEDLSEAEIARVLGCRPGTVKSLAARGLDRLRQEMPS